MQPHNTTNDAPVKLCECGCGQPLPRPKYPSKQRRFIRGHGSHLPISLEEYFWLHCPKGTPDDCWKWQGGSKRTGYGIFKLRRRSYSAHRVAWELFNGPIPDGLIICHRCDNPPCCNPAHMFLGTHADNAADRDKKKRHVALRGKQHGNAKIAERDAREIRHLRKKGMLLREIAERYHLSLATIHNIVSYKAWKHIP